MLLELHLINCTLSLYISTDSLGVVLLRHPLTEFRLDWDSLLPLTLHNLYFFGTNVVI